MKTSIFKRSMALFLAFLLCFTTFVGSAVTPAFAAGTESEVVLIGFPRDGDDMYHTGTWGNEALTLMNGWAVLRARQTIVRSVGSYYGPICYCLEPGVPLNSGDHLTDRDETYWDNYPAGYNNTISPDDIKLLIGRIMQYGYTGTVSDNWRTQNEGGDKLAHATATQLLIWETVVGERDADFKKVSTGGYDAVLDQISQDHPLNDLYDAFVDKYGRITSRANNSAFSMDSSYFLLSSLEVLDDERNFVRKADMFTKRTIKQKVVVTSVDTASEALAVSLAEKAKVDMPYMMELTGKTEQEIYTDLTGVIFLNPMFGYSDSVEEKYLTADEYLSGNVREKLEWARRSAELYPEDYTANVQALERVQPTDLTASEISVRLGATWLPPEIIEQFMFELFSTPNYCRFNIHVRYFQQTGEWNIEGKSYDRSNVKASGSAAGSPPATMTPSSSGTRSLKRSR